MNSLNLSIKKTQQKDNEIFQPLFFNLREESDKKRFNDLLNSDPELIVLDEIDGQLRELIKSLNPSIKIKAEEYPALIESHLAGRDLEAYGQWVYYPWNRRIIHVLDEEEFIEIRTNRNRYKITREEQGFLKKKKIGIIGLSVGQSIALTMAMERIGGELRLADFDTAELSNLNRIRTGLHNLGLKKTIIAAREILEIDPYIKIKVFSDGLTDANMDAFFEEDGRLDLLVEVCDGLDIKIQSRFKARSLHIPVVMDTNDKGMLDVERFDLEPERPILHGLAGDLDPNKIKDLTNEQKIPYILKMVGADTISSRLKASMMEVEQSINTWPQLASSVVLGGALTTDVSRRILLDQYHESGRYYVDFDELIKDEKSKVDNSVPAEYIAPAPMSNEHLQQVAKNYKGDAKGENPGQEKINRIVEAGILAPSGGNVQPWKFLYHDNKLFIFHELHYSYSLLDYKNLGSYVAIGAAIENISIEAAALGYEIVVDQFPLNEHKELVAVVTFKSSANANTDKKLAQGIRLRLTNRNVERKEILPEADFQKLKDTVASFKGAELKIVDDEATMAALGDIFAETEMHRIIHPRGHYDTFKNELRWTPEENAKLRDGLDVATLGATTSEIAALSIAGDDKAIAFLRSLKGGKAFKKMVNKAVAASSALGIITMPEYSETNFLNGGRALERMWIEANLMGISLQPIAQYVFLMARLKYGNGEGLDSYFEKEFETLGNKFLELMPDLENKQPIFIFRLCKASEPKIKSLRRPIESAFIYL